MSTNTERLLHNLPTLVALLRRETWVDSYHLVPSIPSFDRKYIEKRAPTSVHDALCKVMIFDHVVDLQILNNNQFVSISILLCRFEVKVFSLTATLEVCLCRALTRLTSSLTSLFTSTYRSLLTAQCSLTLAVKTGVSNGVAFGVSQKGLESHINTNIAMSAFSRSMLILRFGFADNEDVPMGIGTKHKMSRFRSAFHRTMVLDFDRPTQLARNVQMFLIRGKQHITTVLLIAVLSQLDTLPLIRFLETRETNTSDVVLFCGKKAFEGLTHSIGKHLYSGCRNRNTVSLESGFEVILARKRPILLILCFDGFKHGIVYHARLDQALHEQNVLFFRCIQAVFICPHSSILPQITRSCKESAIHPLPEGEGHSCRTFVDKSSQ